MLHPKGLPSPPSPTSHLQLHFLLYRWVCFLPFACGLTAQLRSTEKEWKPGLCGSLLRRASKEQVAWLLPANHSMARSRAASTLPVVQSVKKAEPQAQPHMAKSKYAF